MSSSLLSRSLRSSVTPQRLLRFSSSAPAPPPPPAPSARPPPNRHVRFYRDILPPMVRVLAYGSAVYFAAHLAWTLLDGREQRALENEVRERLEGDVRQRREALTQEEKGQEHKAGWMGWFSK